MLDLLVTWRQAAFMNGKFFSTVNEFSLKIFLFFLLFIVTNISNLARGFVLSLTEADREVKRNLMLVAAVSVAQTFQLPNIPSPNPARTVYCQSYPAPGVACIYSC